ncbi:tetratricopeptide repeat protein [Bradyrhizobium genomosp. III]|uniref:tetratricopeptide repeat protein n=1 Tax=Bradyrhizobium genomosp. III TaxID=2683271 RepID=UPI0004ACF7F4|nr:tetratricopeptide repeat protein [Bradyrhizobium sp. CCBAU 15635]
MISRTESIFGPPNLQATGWHSVRSIVVIAIIIAATLLGSSSGSARSQRELLDDARKLNAEIESLYSGGRYADAIPLAKRSLAITEEALGPVHSDVAESLNNLGLLLAKQGSLADAEPFYRRSLTVRETLPLSNGNSIEIATTLNNLANLYVQQGRHADAAPLSTRSIELLEQALGPNDQRLASPLNNLSFNFRKQGRYANARTLLERALQINEKELGRGHPEIAKILSNIANIYEDEGRYSEAEPLLNRALTILEAALSPDHPDLSIALNNLAGVYNRQGRYLEAELLYNRALLIAEKSSGPDNLSTAVSLNNLAMLYANQARFLEAASLAERALMIFQEKLPPDHPDVATSLSNLGTIYENLGRYGDLESLYKRSLTMTEKTFGPNNPTVAVSLHNLAGLYLSQGRAADAEQLFMRELTIYDTTFGPDHLDAARSLNALAIISENREQPEQAEVLYKRALAIREKMLGPDHPLVALLLDNLSVLYGRQRRYTEAEQLSRRSLAISENSFGPNHPDVAAALSNLASLYDRMGRYAEAAPLFGRSLDIRVKSHGWYHPDVASTLNYLALLYDKLGHDDEAESLYEKALAIRERVLGPNHADVAQSLNNLAGICDKRGRPAEAYAYIQRTFENKSSRKYPSFSVILNASRSNLITTERSFADSFNVLQFSSSSAAAEAVQRLAQRYSAGTDELAHLVRQDQDLITEANSIDRQLVSAASKDPSQRNQVDEDRIRRRSSEIQSARSNIADVLTRHFPDYVALSNPPPLNLREVQELLTDDEAIVAIDIGRKSYAWVITKTDASWTDIPADSNELNGTIARLRQSLNFTVDMPFDTGLAYAIYQQTFGRIEDRLAGKRRISLITNGALTSIPPQLLVRRDPTGKPLTEVDWLVRAVAITVIPSVYSLKTMRAQRQNSAAPMPMVAFADPIFSRTARVKTAQRSMTSYYSGTQLDIRALAETLDQLPSTKDEVTRVAIALHASTSDIHTGLEATETAVKQAPLDQYRVVYFATHALVAGDLKDFAQSKAEPALVLTIPASPTDDDDGLLDASEVSELKLNADWVVLSACNTAAGDSVGAEALSGLARAFFYAGARSLVVSHWDVLDNETALLMTDLFKRSSQNVSLSHGQALQQAQLNILKRARNDSDAHPRVWAPFVVVGEPAITN